MTDTPARQPHPQPDMEKKYCDHWVVCKHAHALLYCPADAMGKHHKECEYDTRSRPHPAPADEQCRICSQATAKAEREDALNEFMMAIEYRFEDTNNGRGVVGTIRGLKESLRSKGGEQ